ncbi:hypothetical protein BDFG_05636 [Blastomyces dermatitidis ATCC 26199]|nr:hypothetical protein BDFG_05636 [Blastomyces dermatitidis ATCC 26199]
MNTREPRGNSCNHDRKRNCVGDGVEWPQPKLTLCTTFIIPYHINNASSTPPIKFGDEKSCYKHTVPLNPPGPPKPSLGNNFPCGQSKKDLRQKVHCMLVVQNDRVALVERPLVLAHDCNTLHIQGACSFSRSMSEICTHNLKVMWLRISSWMGVGS